MIENVIFAIASLLVVLVLRKLKTAITPRTRLPIYYAYGIALIFTGSQFFSIFSTGELMFFPWEWDVNSNYFVRFWSFMICLVAACTCLPKHPEEM
ncbi:hypothetical protein [Vibrio tubiashii]|uniref:hypothetical protein n=1 Tax=Vibrio tubiashii TaxID=29498 RepID=UPI00349EC968